MPRYAKVSELRPGMDGVYVVVRLVGLDQPKEVETRSGRHVVAEGVVEDDSGSIGLRVWDERVEELSEIRVGDLIEVGNGFVTSYRGVWRLNVGRMGYVRKVRTS